MLLHQVHNLKMSLYFRNGRFLLFLAIAICSVRWTEGADGYYGKLIGKLSELHHGVSGTVYAVDARTLHIRDLTYDGEGPDAFFYVGSSKSPSGTDGTRIRDENGTFNILKRYRKKHITLTLPEGKSLANIRWFSIWCREFSVNFGDVRIPKGFEYPKPYTLAALSGIHGVSSDPVVVVDSQTLLVPNFSYDGEAPDAKFWVGSSSKPSPQGIRVADENGLFSPLKKYQRQTLVITLPGSLTVHQIGHFGVWCEAFAVDFAHVEVPPEILVPPSLRTLGVSPQSKLNCEVLHEHLAFEVRWAVAGDSVVTQLVGKIDAGDYMAFGVSGVTDRTQMIGGDAVVAWVDRDTLQGHAQDYYLDAKSQCAGTHGSCPDQRLEDGANSVRLLNAALVNGYSIITYQRPLRARDHLDRPIFTNGTRQAIIWAVGPLNSRNEVSYHSAATRGNVLFDFGRSSEWNCPLPESGNVATEASLIEKYEEPDTPVTPEATIRPQATPAPSSTKDAWHIPPIQCNEPEDGVFYAQMGPTGGKRGYPAITGHVGWGISWYINGLLIPEINVVRGKSYTFVVEGGDDPEVPARYHPFYITDDSVGGYEYKTAEERKKVRVFAGIKFDKRGKATPTGTGRLCNWTPDPEYPADESESFGAYQRTLRLECDPGEPGILRWTPDANTPDSVYYQCYTHRYLGWKINVLDSCDLNSAATDNHNVEYEDYVDSIEPEASIQVDTRVKIAGKVNETSFSDENNEQDSLLPSAESTAQMVSYITSLTSQAEKSDAKQAPLEASHIKKDNLSQETKFATPQIPQKHPSNGFGQEEFGDQLINKGNKSPDDDLKSITEGGRRNGDVNDGPIGNESLFESPKETESFEPMFIPSPIDRNRYPANENVSKSSLIRPLIGSSHHSNINSLDNKHLISPFRHPGTSLLVSPANRLRPLKRPQPHRGSQLQSHGMSPPAPPNNFRRFTSKRPVSFGDTPAGNERVDMFYLPPNLRFPSRSIPQVKQLDEPGLVLTYDGKPVKDASLINPPPTEQLTEKPKGRSSSVQSSEYLQATPQFRPFNGEIPPPVPNLIRDHKNIPQLRLYSNAEPKIDSTEETADLVKSVVRRWADHEPGHDADEQHHPEPSPEPEPEPSDDHNNNSKTNSSSMLCNTFFVVIIAGVILFRF